MDVLFLSPMHGLLHVNQQVPLSDQSSFKRVNSFTEKILHFLDFYLLKIDRITPPKNVASSAKRTCTEFSFRRAEYIYGTCFSNMRRFMLGCHLKSQQNVLKPLAASDMTTC